MKKTLLAVAVHSLFLPALLSTFVVRPARAQSQLSLYGIVDGGITYTNSQQTTAVGKGGANLQASSGGLHPSLWGLKGREDLGGGYATVFTLENGFDVANGGFGRYGQGSAAFGRLAYVGLSGNQWGTLTAGRQYDPFSDTVGAYSASNNWAGRFGAHFGDIDNLNQSIAISNALKYVASPYTGVNVGGLYALGGHAGNFSQDRTWSLSASYANGPLSVGAGYLNMRSPLVGTLAGNTGGAYTASGSYDGSLGNDYVDLQRARSNQVFGAGGAYTWGPTTVNLVFTRTRLLDSQYFVGSGGPTSTVRMDNYEVGARYLLTPALTAGVSYTFTNGKADYLGLSPRFHQINLGGNYLISKQTVFYLVATYQKAVGDGIVYSGNGLYVPIAETPGLGDAGTGRQISVTVGLKYAF